MRWTTLGAGACVGLAGCATWLDVQPLATGRQDVAAYALNGDDLPALHREARRLCPQGVDVVRQASQGQQAEPPNGRWRAWLNQASAWIDPPQRAAQLMVVCRDIGNPAPAAQASAAMPANSPNRPNSPAALAAPQTAQRPSTPAGLAARTPTATAAALPIGPLSVEW